MRFRRRIVAVGICAAALLASLGVAAGVRRAPGKTLDCPPEAPLEAVVDQRVPGQDCIEPDRVCGTRAARDDRQVIEIETTDGTHLSICLDLLPQSELTED